MGETQMAIYRTALDAERKMHEECNADLNRALDTITSRNTKIAQLEERVAELEEQLKHTWGWVTELEGENGGLVSENEALKTEVNRERYWKEKSEKGMKALLDFWYSDPDGVRPILDDSE